MHVLEAWGNRNKMEFHGVSAGHCALGTDSGCQPGITHLEPPFSLSWCVVFFSEPQSDIAVAKAHTVLGYSCGHLAG